MVSARRRPECGLSAAGIPVDGPLATFGDINRGRWPEKFGPLSATLFASALNNYWRINFPRGHVSGG